MQFDLRQLPGMSVEHLRSELKERLGKRLHDTGLSWELIPVFEGIPAMETPREAAIVQAVEKLTGSPAGAVAFGTEGPYLNSMGMQTVICGPGQYRSGPSAGRISATKAYSTRDQPDTVSDQAILFIDNGLNRMTQPTNESSNSFVEWFRGSSPYIHAHRGRTFVISFGGEAVVDAGFANLVHDIALLHGLGIRLVLVHGRPVRKSRNASRPGV